MDLVVEGRHALLFDDDSTASFVNSRDALVPWNYDASLLIDRYDVRHLLDRIPPRPANSSRRQRLLDDACDAISLAELDGERYRDLPPGDEERKELDSDIGRNSEATGSGAYQNVPFSYGDQNMHTIHENTEYNSSFRPPFEVPEYLINHLPPTEKLHQIMARTAIFVSDHGGQSEIVLRVKQGNNPTFGFLMPDHHLHVYFRYLVDHPQILKHYNDSPKTEEKDKANNHIYESGALSLLGSVYGTGDDDDAYLQTEIKEKDAKASMKVGNGESSTSVVGNEGEIKPPSSTCTKEKPVPVKKMAQGSHKGTADHKSSIMEPPSFLKRTIEKIVEFIIRNGKQFEAVLIEQDRNIGRFPFLHSTNQYHSYYLKIFEDAHEMKMQGKNLFDEKNDAERHGGNKKKLHSHGKDTNVDDQDFPRRTEKFKMVLGAQKKDSQDQQSKATNHLPGLSADEAADIILAATRGVNPANTFCKRSPDDGRSSRNSGATVDEAAAIVMAATRGRSPANPSQNISRDNERTSNFASNGISGTSAQSDKKSCLKTSSDVTVATIIAKSVALAASREADSVEAGLTKEQKLKAERLKRAKMFSALIKSGDASLGELVNSVSNRSGSVEPANGCCSMKMEREGSSVPFDTEALGREHESRKRHHSRFRGRRDDSNDDDDHKHVRKKHHSSSYKDEKDAINHHKRSSEHRRHRHHHRVHDYSSDDEGVERSEPRRRKDRSRSNRKRESEAGDDLNSMEEHSEGPAVCLTGASDRRDMPVNDDKQPLDATEIPNDLRAKIRAMLLETL